MTRSGRLGLRLAQKQHRTAIEAFLGRLSPITIRQRYFVGYGSLVGTRAESELHRLLDGDRSHHVVLLAVEGAEVRGVGEFSVTTAGAAELALLVEDAYQNCGIGHRLFARLLQLARTRNVRTFNGEVLYDNRRVLHLLKGRAQSLQLGGGTGAVRFVLPIQPRTRRPRSVL